MKKNSIFIGILILLFIIMYYSNLNNPPKFIWNPTYSTKDKQPYGAFALDEMLAASWSEGYYHSYENIPYLYSSEEIEDKSVLIITDYFNISYYEIDDFMKYIRSGGTVFVAANTFEYSLTDTLKIFTDYNFFSSIKRPFEDKTDAVFFSNSISKDSISGIPRSMLSRSFSIEKDQPLSFRTYSIASDNEDLSLLIRCDIGEGHLYLCSTPLLFTNYAILSDSINPFIRQALAPLKGRALLRTEYYGLGRSDRESTSPFRYLLSQPSLEWAFYIVIITAFLFMIFTAKRKQKSIPIVKTPPNKMLEFVRSISTLYLKKNNNADIIMKKYIYWSDDVKKKYGIDVVNEQHNKAFIKQFSAKTGMLESDARYLFLELDGIREHTEVSDEEMMDLITKMKID